MMALKHKMVIAGLAMLTVSWVGPALAIDSAQSGFWDVGATWVGGSVPTGSDDVTITNGCTVAIRTNILNDIKSLTILANGVLTHTNNSTTALGERYKVVLDVANNLTIDVGGQINVDAKGYAAANGPGKPSGSGAGSYGGLGGYKTGNDPGPTYGSITGPTNLGSGGSSTAGGGAARLIVAGTTTVNGAISAAGGAASFLMGSGGSVFLTTGSLTGNGTISANGGKSIGNDDCSGGGGRVAVVLTNSTDFSNVKMQAYSDFARNSTFGAAGTIYLQTSAQVPGQGTLVIDANNIVPSTPNSTTLISSQVTDTVVGTVVITNSARLQIDANQSLTVNGSWQNGTNALFIASSISTVIFASMNPATITGHNTYYNLVCTNADKMLRFEDGKTNTVNGILTLAGATLNSTSGSGSWFLKASPTMHSVSNVKVSRSDANPGATIEAYDSTDQGGNSNWVFATSGLATNIWTGATDSDWSRTNNWSLNRTTIYTDRVLIPGSCSNYPMLNFHKRLLSLTIASNATMSLSGYDLTVDQTISVTGTLTAVGAATVTIGGNLDFTGGGVFNAASSTVRIVGSIAQTVVSAGNAFYQLTISNSAAPVVFADAVVASNIVNLATPVTFAGPVTVASAFRTQGTNVTFGGAVTATIFQNANGALVFSGALTAQAFSNVNGALVFSGAVATVTFTNWQGDLTFRDNVSTRDFYCAPGGMALMFNTGKTYTVGNLDLYGRVGYPIQLRSSGGSHWYLNVTNRATVRLVDVQYSDASGGLTIYPLASTNSGNNPNWDFGVPYQTWIGADSAVFTNGNNWVPAGAFDSNAHLLIDGYYTTAPILSGVATAAQMIVGGGVTTATLTVNGQLTTLGNMDIQAKGTITHSANTSSETNKLNLTVGSNLTIDLGGQINVDGKGYAAANGPGKPPGSGAGSYGGLGGYKTANDPGPTYGSITAPTNLGSGGSSTAGGGAVQLIVTGTTTVNGAISAAGGAASFLMGSGGSVFLTTGSLTGNGTISAKGGKSIGNDDCSGGGGRVAVVLTNSTDFSNVKMQAYSDFARNSTFGAAGTVYLQTSAQGPGQGTLMIDASNIVPIAASTTTLISSQVTDTVVGTVVITNSARLQIGTNQSLTVNGSWMKGTNTAFIANSNSTVIFASANPATITSSNTFYNLICTNAGKPVYFQAGRTNTVNGLLKLGSTVPGSTVALRSTAEGDWWYLTLVAGMGTQQIARVTVKDSNAGGGQKIYAGVGSLNLLNNVNWIFPAGGMMFTVH